jgi:hypothetical protein
VLTQARGSHALKYGFDGRRTQLNSFLNRGYRPQVVYGGAPDLTALFAEAAIKNPSQFGPTPAFSAAPTWRLMACQPASRKRWPSTLLIPRLACASGNLISSSMTVGRRGAGWTLDYGLRYELNTVPREVNQRIEQTFGLDQLPANDPNLRLAAPFTGGATIYDSQRLLNSFDATLGAYRQILAGRTGIYDADRNNFSPHFSFAYDPFAGSSTQAGKTAVRAGFGLYYDLNLGSVVSQSRNVFPTFIPFNVDANTFFYARSAFSQFNQTYAIFNPTFVPVDVVNGTRRDTYGLIGAGQLNTLQLPDGILQQLLGLLFDPSIGGGRPSGGGLAFTLPDKRLRSPYTLQYNLQIERELTKELLANVAYVARRATG